MKAMILLAALVSSSAFAASSKNLIYNCSNGEELTVKLYETDDGYRADVTMQSTGDSYPTYHFRNIHMERGLKKVGAPVVYSNSSFRMAIRHIRGAFATVEVPSLDIKSERLSCK